MWIMSRREPHRALLPVFLAGLVNIPVFFFGNSAGGGVFVADVAIAAFVVRFGFSFGRRMIRRANRNGQLALFAVLVAWVTVGGVIACLQEPRISRFVYYGVARWWTFMALVGIFFGQSLSERDYVSSLRRLGIVMIVYGVLCIAHQHGVVDLSGLENLGPRIVESTARSREAYTGVTPFGHRVFLGANSASTGALCWLGLWAAAVLAMQPNKRLWRFSAILAVVMLWAQAGTWSRSDMVGLVASLALGGVLFFRVAQRRTRQGAALATVAFVGLVTLLACVYPRVTRNPTLERYARAFSQYNPEALGTGGHRFREHSSVLKRLGKNPQILLFGVGPNGYRRLAWAGKATMLFGHNVYLHTVVELGFPGLVLLVVWLWRASQMGVSVLRPARSASMRTRQLIAILTVTMLVQRLVAGLGADTLFATNTMLPANVMFLGLVGMAFSTYGPHFRGKQAVPAPLKQSVVGLRSATKQPRS